MCVLVLFLRRRSTVVRKFSNHSMKQRLYLFSECFWAFAAAWPPQGAEQRLSQSPGLLPPRMSVPVFFIMCSINFLCAHVYTSSSGHHSHHPLEFLFLLFSVKALGLGTLYIPDECLTLNPLNSPLCSTQNNCVVLCRSEIMSSFYMANECLNLSILKVNAEASGMVSGQRLPRLAVEFDS